MEFGHPRWRLKNKVELKKKKDLRTVTCWLVLECKKTAWLKRVKGNQNIDYGKSSTPT